MTAANIDAANIDIVLDNDRVVVRRVTRSGLGPVSSAQRHDRLIIYLKDARIARSAGGSRQTIMRKAGDVIWQPASEHEIEHLDATDHEVLIVELKA
jgi:hypothetical protein